jgi:excinuclease ABC subunit C
MGLPVSLRELVKPESPGVYIMRDERGKVLYVGKAINLRQRINQYLGLQDSREFIPRLVSELADIEYILTNDEREALLVERQLIRKLRPRYNVLLRDDKNFLLVRLDGGHPFPRFEFVRRRRKDRARYFGPFPPAKVLRQYVRFLSKAFRLRLCGDRQLAQRIRPCLYHGTGSCSAPCWLPEANLDYRERLDAAAALLGRKTSEARRLVEQSMLQASAAERYEEAARFRDLLFALDGLWGEHGTAIQGTAEADVFAIHRGPLGGALFALHVREGVVTGHQAVFNELFYNSQTCDFDSLVYQYYENRTPPALVIGPFPPETVGALTSLLAEEHGRKMELVNPGKGDRRALLDMAQANAKLAYERESARALARLELLAALAAAFDLPSAPAVIECVDISSFQGGDAVGTVAVARDGLPATSAGPRTTIVR